MMLNISPQSLEGKDNILEKCLEGLFKKDLITVLAVDEMHRVPLDAPAFRTAFGKLQKKLVKKRSLSSAMFASSRLPFSSHRPCARLSRG